jgi:anti-anti-sigma factor
VEHGITEVDGMKATVEQTGEAAWRVVVAGELDAATAPELADVLDPLVSQPAASVVVNLADVSFMDSSGLRALIRSANAAKEAGGSLVLARASASVTRLLEVTGLIEQLHPESAD